MSIERRVMWLEGAFLRPQHFQQQDRRTSALVAERAAATQPFHWGFSQLEIDDGALRQGAVALRRCRGSFQDGEVFGWPGEIANLPSIRPPRTCQNTTVYLLIPQTGAGGRLAEATDGQETGARYIIDHTIVDDILNPSKTGEPVETGKLNAKLSISDDEPGHFSIPVAHIREVTDDNIVILDPDFIPTVVHASAAPALGTLISEIASLLGARADTLASNASQIGASGNAALIELMLLRIANGKSALFAEMAAANVHHPEMLYRACVELAGELCSFSKAGSRRAPKFLPYNHDEPTPCFNSVMKTIRAALAEVVDPDAFLIPLERWDAGGFYGAISPPDLLPDGRFIIVARSLLDEATFRETFPRQTTVASVNQVLDYVSAQDRGARLEPLSVVPSELRAMSGWTYFELRHEEPCWSDIAASASVAIYEANAFQDLQLELWGIRSKK